MRGRIVRGKIKKSRKSRFSGNTFLGNTFSGNIVHCVNIGTVKDLSLKYTKIPNKLQSKYDI